MILLHLFYTAEEGFCLIIAVRIRFEEKHADYHNYRCGDYTSCTWCVNLVVLPYRQESVEAAEPGAGASAKNLPHSRDGVSSIGAEDNHQ